MSAHFNPKNHTITASTTHTSIPSTHSPCCLTDSGTTHLCDGDAVETTWTGPTSPVQDGGSAQTSNHGVSQNSPVGDYSDQEAIQHMWVAFTHLASHDKKILMDDEIWEQAQGWH
ncbi:uncharacterized protein ARMOST_00597 [Armillaria ostoyae]|uniref:Uncharacterized protein n=1 Tax=Armillaria ostoyae TaxID=47428 RepID=A0A284QLK6_ARMOS|nr:uncharacterized protein ARMOST_00597 [Armillaria ostoyae]